MANTISCNRFTNYLLSQTPVYDKRILADIRPEDAYWIGAVETAPWEPFTTESHTQDRFTTVFPDLTKPWKAVAAPTSCIGTPCDLDANEIGWGTQRKTYQLERQSWQTPLLCYDQMLLVTHAKEHFRQIISDILKPATGWIMSNFLKKRCAQNAGKKQVATTGMPDFLFSWETTGGGDIFMNVTLSDGVTAVDPTSKLTPQMIQRRYNPQILQGALGKRPFAGAPGMLQLVTDMETIWELDKAAADSGELGVGYVPKSWRFTEWDAANEYYKYGFSGKIGNFAVRLDPFGLRFNRVSAGRYQVVLPYKNVSTTVGMRSIPNPDFETALYAFSYIHNYRSIRARVMDPAPVNPEMPFSSRNFGGRWQFVMDNLGTTPDGCVIENKRRNKGQFIADFELAIEPNYVEFEELFFHMREPACVVLVSPCSSDPGHPTQYYNSANDPCPNVLVWTPTTEASDGHYAIAENTITCNGVPIVHTAINQATLAGLVAALPAILGTWAVVDGSTTDIQLSGSTCDNVGLPFLA